MSPEQEATLSGSDLSSLADTTARGHIVFQDASQSQLALQDIRDGISKTHIWVMLAYQDIKLRYKRSVLGPFWLTLSMAITVYSMGFLYGMLFKLDVAHYLPYLMGGMLCWTLISTAFNELVETFIICDGMMKQIKLPYSLYIHKIAFRNILIFFHNILVIVPIYFIFHESIQLNWHFLLLFPGLLLLYTNTFVYGLILAMLGARFRDITQIVKSLIQVIFFVTPVMWNAELLPADKRAYVMLNPFHSLLEIIRAPIMGTVPSLANYAVVGIMILFGGLICWQMFTRYRSRIIYWI